MSNDTEHDRFVTIPYFTHQMMGMRDRGWYYRHARDPGMPQRVRIGGKPMLSLEQCKAYMAKLVALAEPAAPLKRRVGRPRKPVTPLPPAA